MNKKQKNKSKKKLVVWSFAGILVAALAVAAVFMPKGTGAFQEAVAETGDIATFYSFAGVIEAKNRETVMSEKAMQISEIQVKEGDKVKTGDVLLMTAMGEEIKASVDGEISKVLVEKNAELMSGIELLEIVDYSDLQANVKVDEYSLKFLEEGRKVNVTINALDKEIAGSISELSKEAANENGISYFTATIDLAKDEELRIGMSAEAKILKEEAKKVTTLPIKVIQFDSSDKPYVLLPSEQSLPTKKYISTGINDGTVVEIKSGISAGDSVMYTDNEEAQAAASMRGEEQ
ncbi:efflux RND transporter periplasmic adaptor subunit [Planomicrobium sp. CPCC 101110]|uniref:efflux RND transporter periplasmic adaptor subunit n=1 Tax=Planomicrobium sp. CPCC 101110 TaxID=2599619 RepID=UPI0011B68467|nr:HlyD family efflux transporter periplasmic adaptor subunit [Planomicrobium sp. CPCC 101110]TWT25844.1 HlyD family efflux transporter periplasmic adaptor subunit [Planomicrobium sp. CPCC 101110]